MSLFKEKYEIKYLARQFWLGSAGAVGAFIPDHEKHS